MNTILTHLPDTDRTRAWRERLDTIPQIPSVAPFDPERMLEDLLDLAVPHEAIDSILAATPTPERHPEAWALLERVVAVLDAAMGETTSPPQAPDLPGNDALARWFHVYALLAMKPRVEAWHRQRGIPADVTRRTLADLGRNIAVHHKRTGEWGFSFGFWLQLHVRGAIYQLGRLQFERAQLGTRTGEAIRAAGLRCGPGDPAMNLHITDFSGPLSPALCDQSLHRARVFFTRHFPDTAYHIATCHSWLLDPQLAAYLPETSNIIRFQRRFTLVPVAARVAREPEDDSAFRFVFGKDTSAIDTLPRVSSVQRAVIDHVRNGGHWYGGSGWFTL